MYIHVLLFECLNCNRAIPVLRISDSTAFTAEEKAEFRTDLKCLSKECGWTQKDVSALAAKHFLPPQIWNDLPGQPTDYSTPG